MSHLLARPFVKVQIKENTKAPRHWHMWAKPPVTKRFPSQKASNTENVSIWWCYQEQRRLAGCVQYCDHLSHKPKGILGFMETHHCSYHVCIVELGHHWFRQWLGAEQVPSHFLNKFEFKFFKWIDFFMYFEVKSYSCSLLWSVQNMIWDCQILSNAFSHVLNYVLSSYTIKPLL